MINILGIDPGISGAMALLNDQGKLLELCDIPVLVDKVVNGKAKNVINYKQLQNTLMAWIAEYGEMMCYLESVHAMPTQGVTSMFNMGATYGAIRAVLACENIVVEQVAPQTWKKQLKIPMGPHLSSAEKKEISRGHAIKLFPHDVELFARKADHNRAEAALIAKYGAYHNDNR